MTETTTTIKISRGAFRHVEAELYDYPETRREIIRIRNEILYGSTSEDENVGGGRSNLPGNPTQQTATRLVTDKRLRHMETVVDAIESVVERLPEKKKQLAQLRYWDKPRTLTWDGVAMRLNVSRRTVMNWRDEIVFAIAEKIGWR